MTWPQVGAEALLRGTREFSKDANTVIGSMDRIRGSARDLASDYARGWEQASHASLVAVGTISAGMIALTTGAVLAGTALLTMGAQFDQIMHQNAAVIDAPIERLADLADSIRDVANTTSTEFNEVARTAGDFVKAGVNIQTVIDDGLQSLVDFNDALVGEGSLTQAATIVAGALNLFDLSADQTRRVVESLTAATVTSAATIGTVLTAFAQFGPTAAANNLTLDQTNLLISLMGRNAILGGRAGTALKVMFSQLQAPSKAALELMKQFNLSLYDANGNMVDAQTMIARLQAAFGDQTNALNKMTDAQRQQALATIFGTDGMRAAIVLAEEGVEGYNKLAAAFVRTDLARMAEEARNSLIPQLEIMRNILTSLTTLMTGQFIPTLVIGTKNINTFLKSIDPAIPKVFGDAILGIITGIQTVSGGTFTSLLGPFGQTIEEIVSGFMRLRAAVFEHLIPSILFFKNALTGTNEGVRASVSVVQFLANAMVSIVNAFATGFYWAGRFAAAIRESSAASQVFGTVLRAYVLLTVAGLVLGLVKLSTTFTTLGTNAAMAAIKIAASIALFIAQTVLLIVQMTLLGIVTTVQIGTMVVQFALLAATAVISAAMTVGAWIGAAVGFVIAWAPIALWMVAQFILIQTAALISAGITAAAWISAMAPILLIFAAAAVAVAVLAVAWANDWLGIRSRTEAAVQAIIFLINFLAEHVGKEIVRLATIVSNVWQFMFKNLWQAALDFVGGIGPFFNRLGDFIGNVFTGLKAFVGVIWGTIWSVAGDQLTAFAKFVSDLLNTIFSWIADQIVRAGKYYADVWQKVWFFIASVVSGAGQIISNILTTVLTWIGNALNSAGATINTIWASIWDGVVGVVARAIIEIGKLVQKLITSLKGVSITMAIPGLGLTTFKPFQILSDLIEDAGATWNKVSSDFVSGAGVAVEALGDLRGVVNDLLKGELSLDDAFKKVGFDAGKLFGDLFKEPRVPWWKKMLDDIARKGEEMRRLWELIHPVSGEGISFPAGGEGGGGGGGKGGGAGGAPTEAEALEALKDLIRELTADIPGMTEALIEFLATLETADPGRLMGMIQALRDQSLLIGQILIASEQILLARLELLGIEQRLAQLAAQGAVLAAERAIVENRYAQQLLTIRTEIAQLDLQMLPVRFQIAAIDREINQLQRENFALTKERAQIEYDALPLRYKIRDIEKEITDVVDKRLSLTRREAEIRAQMSANALDKELRGTTKALDAAWAAMDVPAILRLEEQKTTLEEEKVIADERLTAIRDQVEEQRLLDELKTIGFEHEKLTLEELIEPYEHRLEMIDREVETTKARNAITVAGLQEQKAHLEELLFPLEELRIKLEQQNALIELQQQIELAQYEQRKLQLEALKDQEDLRKAQLDEIILKQEQAITDLVLQFADALAASQAFSLGESVEVAKRMGFWNDQIAKIAEVAVEFGRVSGEVDKLTEKILAIPRDVAVTVTVTTNYATTGSAGGSGGDMPSMQHGGVVPGPYGQPRMIVAHGGERFLGMHHSTPMAVQMAQSHAPSVSNSTTSNQTNVTIHSPVSPRGTEAQMWGYTLRDIVEGTRR